MSSESAPAPEDKFNAIIELQETIIELSDANFSETQREIIESGWLGSEQGIKQLATTIHIACKCRTAKIPLLAKFLSEFRNARLNKIALHGIFRTLAFQKPVPLESGFMSFLYHCFKCGIFDANEVIRRMKLLKKDTSNKRSLCWLFCYFAPEIEAVDSAFAKKCMRNMERYRNVQMFPQIFKNFARDLEQLRENNWQLLKQRREFFMQKQTFVGMIRNDDVEALKAASAAPGFNVETRILPTAFLPSPFLMGHPTLVQTAAFFGSLECFKFLLMCGADQHAMDWNSVTLPQFAVAGGNAQIVRMCQQNNIDFYGTAHVAARFHRNDLFEWLKQTVVENIGDINLEGQNIIHAACESNNIYVMKVAAADGVDPNGRTYHGRTPLRVAVRRGFIDSVEFLLSLPQIDLNSKTMAGVMPFHLAAKYGDIDIAKMLLARGDIDINEETEQHRTAFYLAVLNNRLNMTRFLMGFQHIDVNKPNAEGVSPLMTAIWNDLPGIVKLLIADPRTNVNTAIQDHLTPMFFAIRSGRMYALEALLKRPDIDMNMHNEFNLTYLHLAVKQESPEALAMLMKKGGIDVNGADVKGYTPLHTAVYTGSVALVKLLLSDPNINTNALTEHNATPLHFVGARGDAEMAFLFVTRDDVDINAPTLSGTTPLHTAIYYNNVGVVLALLSRTDLDVNAQSCKGNVTPLIMACDRGYAKIVELLLTHPHIRPELKMSKGYTALTIARARKFDNVVELLRSRFSDEAFTKSIQEQVAIPAVPRTLSMEGPSLVDGLLDNDALMV